MDFIEALNNFVSKTNDVGFLISVVLSVFSLTIVYYFLMNVARHNNSSILIFLMVFIIIFSGASFVLNENLDGVFFFIFPLLLVVIVVCLFSVEIKRSIWAKKSLRDISFKQHSDEMLDEETVKHCIEEIIKALQDMAKNDIGALIVLTTGNMPAQILDSGIKIDSNISSELIESIFFPKTPLHDGAMIINGTKIVSAGCFLPLSQKIDTIQKDLGTRHRAGMGITENIDVISLIVSEETGIISVAKGGALTRFADAKMLNSVLSEYFWQDIEGGKK